MERRQSGRRKVKSGESRGKQGKQGLGKSVDRRGKASETQPAIKAQIVFVSTHHE